MQAVSFVFNYYDSDYDYESCRIYCRWYIKAHEINPKNGKPYNQLAVLAVCAVSFTLQNLIKIRKYLLQRRKLDAVYYYMRSLMSSNPVTSAKEHLVSLFDENKKKVSTTLLNLALY